MIDCQNCGTRLSERFGRVLGDEDDRVHRCLHCDSWTRVARGTAAGLEVEESEPNENPASRLRSPYDNAGAIEP